MNAATTLPVTGRRNTPDREGANAGKAPLRIMIVDDSLTVRTIFKRMVESDPELVVAGTAGSAERAIAALAQDRPDVILLDLEMPGMGGLEALPHILKAAPEAQVLVVSALTQEGAEATVAALSTGAADTMLKPRPGEFDDDYRSQLLAKIRAFGTPQSDTAPGQPKPAATEHAATSVQPPASEHVVADHAVRPELIAIGASTGGIHALNILLGALTARCDLPILVTQHLPASFVPVFARQMETVSGRATRIAEEGTEIRRGEIVVATGHGHLVAYRAGDRLFTRVSRTPVRSGCLPSVDPMLESLVETCGGRALAIILSGMGRDGAEGAKLLHEAGGTVWAQDAETSAVWGMPGAVSKAGIASLLASPDDLGTALVERFGVSARPVIRAPWK